MPLGLNPLPDIWQTVGKEGLTMADFTDGDWRPNLGFCHGGPMDGKVLTHFGKIYKVAIYPPMPHFLEASIQERGDDVVTVKIYRFELRNAYDGRWVFEQ